MTLLHICWLKAFRNHFLTLGGGESTGKNTRLQLSREDVNFTGEFSVTALLTQRGMFDSSVRSATSVKQSLLVLTNHPSFTQQSEHRYLRGEWQAVSARQIIAIEVCFKCSVWGFSLFLVSFCCWATCNLVCGSSSRATSPAFAVWVFPLVSHYFPHRLRKQRKQTNCKMKAKYQRKQSLVCIQR